jgi:hypothetical protein
MILYVNGDSNSANRADGKFWTEKLQNYLNCDTINQASSGGSNPRILRTTYEFFRNHADTACDFFVVIGWTSWEREEWFFQDQFYQVNASGLDTVPEELKTRYTNWIADKEAICQINKSRQLHKEIIDLHLMLKTLNVKHLFFNALMPFQHEVLSNSELRFDWKHNFIGPYENDLSYYWFLKKQGYIADNNYHHTELAQLCWAEFLIEYINKHNII